MKPILKWAGGKRQLAAKILELIPSYEGTYYEPFFGGGAIFFYQAPKVAVLNDINSEIVNLYNIFFNNHLLKEFTDLLLIHQENHSKEYYFKIREMDRGPDFKNFDKVIKAARIMYLNKACFNGLYRVNSSGYFNVPFNGNKKVNLVQSENFIEISDFFQRNKIQFLSSDFEVVLKDTNKGDFVYLDPPYDVLRDKQSFTTYAKEVFGEAEQIRLANTCKQLHLKGVKWLLSNHNTPLINSLFSDFSIQIVKAKRMINSNSSERGFVDEVLIKNY
jgi:DNA adenine methylase